jgi:peptide/nickel transport system substrate-binding protein/oligopeptide transport system substrate-binding protein
VSISIAEPAHLLPSAVSDEYGSQVLAALFTPLVGYDEGRRPVPRAAESVTSTDNRVWKIVLAEGFTFHNGEPVTADRYLDAWNYAAYGPHAQRNAYLFDRIDGFADMQGGKPSKQTLSGLKKVDDRTFEVTLTSPFADFPAMLGHPAFLPLPKAAFTAPGVLDANFEKAPVGQGPFRIDGTWQPGGPITVARYAAHKAPAKVAKLEFRIYRGSAEAYADLRSGTLDVDPSIPETQLADAKERLGARFATAPTPTVNFLAVPDFEPDYADPRVREAISMAIDRDALINAYFPGSQVSARAFVPPTVPGYRPDSCHTACTFDPAAARKMYQDAGGPPKLQISYNIDGGHQAWVTGLCGQLAKNLGIACTPVAQPKFETLLAQVRGLESIGMFRMTWSMDYPSMESYLSPLFSTGGSSNYAGYRNNDFDSLLRQAGAAANAEQAVPLYQQAEDMLVKDLPVIPLRSSQRAIGHSERVGGVTLDAFDRIDVTTLTLKG